jgi:2-keto-4-pentenoate hydratase/2-oxohepta-3-ene-1,7-dioic acid hydratase in catechol pathway
MKLVALTNGIGCIEADGSVAELEISQPSLCTYLRDGGTVDDLHRRVVRRRFPDVASAGSSAWEGALWGIGMNYSSKQRITGRPLAANPTIFMKAPTSVRVGGGPVLLPTAAPTCVDYEGEIAAIVGDQLYDVAPQTAAKAVVLVTAANDITARDVMTATGNPSLAKSFPGFGQVSPVLADPESAGGLGAIELRTDVNGQIRQHDSSDGMLMSIGAVVSYLSRYVQLLPGDMVLTGTPAGTGDERGAYLGNGDVVKVTVADLPALRTTIVGVPKAAP